MAENVVGGGDEGVFGGGVPANNGRAEAIDPEAARPEARPTAEERERAAGAALLEAVRRMGASPDDVMNMLPRGGNPAPAPAQAVNAPQATAAQPQPPQPPPNVPQAQQAVSAPHAPPQETARPRDPREAPPHYVPVLEQALLWSMDAIERTIDPATGLGAPMHGRLLGELDRGKERDPLLLFFLDEPLLVSDRTGRRFVEARPGQRVVVHACHALRSLLPLTRLDGCPVVHLLPTGILRMVNGEREVGFEVNVEPDPRDPRNPRLVSRESLLGRRPG